MKALSTLKKEAQKSCTNRGHRMKWGQVFGRASGPKSQIARCQSCRKEVLISQHYDPNVADIGGEAVALNCPALKGN